MVVREVSGAAPAPHNANDDVMNAWINSVYFYLQNEFEVMEVIKYTLTPKKLSESYKSFKLHIIKIYFKQCFYLKIISRKVG